MERNEYLKICQKASLFFDKRKRDEIPEELFIKYEGIKYFPKAYTMTFDNGKPVNIAVLQDLKANSITNAKIERVELWNLRK